MQHLGPQKLRINPSPNSVDFLEDLSHELQFADSDQSLLDLVGSASQKNDLIYQENCQFDFTAGHLIPEYLKEFSMKKGCFGLCQVWYTYSFRFAFVPRRHKAKAKFQKREKEL